MKITGLINQNLILVVFASLFFTAIKTSATAKSSFTSSGPKAKMYFTYTTAEYQLARGNLQEALKLLKRASNLGNEKTSAHGLIRLFGKAGRSDLITQQENQFKDDLEIQLIFAKAYLNLGENEKGEKLLSELNAKYPNNAYIAYYYSSFLISSKKLEKALLLIDRFLALNASSPKQALFHFLKAKIFSHLKRFQEAKDSVNTSLKCDSSFDQAWLFKAFLLEHIGEASQAIESYRSFLSLTDEAPLIRQKLVQLLFNTERFDEAEAEFLKTPGNNAEFFFDLALIKWKGKKFEKALKDINISIEKDPYLNNARLLKVEILFGMNKIEPLLNFLQSWLLKNPESNDVLQALVLLKKTTVPTEAIITILNNAIYERKENKKLWITLGDLYTENKNPAKAAESYKKALSLNKDQQLTPKLLYQIAYLNFEMDKKEEIEKTLKKAIEIDKTYYPAYNLLAYYYMLTNQKLDIAYALIKKAITKHPNNVAFLDTEACLLLKLGNKHEAIKILKKAAKLSPHNETIKKRLRDAKK